MRLFNFLSLFALLGMVVLFASCEAEDSADVNQDKIYTTYELFYNSNTDKSIAVAKFRFGGPTGTLLELKDQANVTFDGQSMPYNAFYGGHQIELAGRIASGDFVYTNTDGDIYTNSLPSVDTIAFPFDFDTLSQASAYTLNWGGSALQADEQVGLFIGSWTWGQDALLVQNGDGATNIVIGTDQSGNVALGASTCYMDRSKQVNLSQGTSEGGWIRAKYRAPNQQIQVVQ